MNSLDIELYEYAQQLFEERKLKFKLWGKVTSSKVPFFGRVNQVDINENSWHFDLDVRKKPVTNWLGHMRYR